MRVAINGWFLIHHPHTGTGQYLRALLEWLPQVAPQHEYVLVAPVSPAAPVPLPEGCRLHRVTCGATDFDKLYFEQVLFRRACGAVQADVAHVPHWAPPLFPGPKPAYLIDHERLDRLWSGAQPALFVTDVQRVDWEEDAPLLPDGERHEVPLPWPGQRRVYANKAAWQRLRP